MAVANTHETARWSEAEEPQFLADLEAGCWLFRDVEEDSRRLTFDTTTYAFAEDIMEILVDQSVLSAADARAISGLEELHKIVPVEMTALDHGELNEVSRRLYEQSDQFLDTYRRFVRDFLADAVVGEACAFQATPTVRCHFPNQDGFDWHPRYHSDIMLGHPPQELNVWLPVTDVSGSNSMRIAGRTGSKRVVRDSGFAFPDFAAGVQENAELRGACDAASAPVEMPYGEVLLFDPQCLHCTQFNTSDRTRISLDFRIISVSEYDAIELEYRGTGRRRMRFARGEYYDQRTTADL